jgi:hypothetical protein
MSAPDWNPIVGDWAIVFHCSDRTAYTVIRVSPSSKILYLQADVATLDQRKPFFEAGGFAGQCVNSHEQRYTYQANFDGRCLSRQSSQLVTNHQG